MALFLTFLDGEKQEGKIFGIILTELLRLCENGSSRRRSRMFGVMKEVNNPAVRKGLMAKLALEEKEAKKKEKIHKQANEQHLMNIADQARYKDKFEFYVCNVVFFYTDGTQHGSEDREWLKCNSMKEGQAIADVWKNFILGNV